MMYRRSNFGGKCGVQSTGSFSMRSKVRLTFSGVHRSGDTRRASGWIVDMARLIFQRYASKAARKPRATLAVHDSSTMLINIHQFPSVLEFGASVSNDCCCEVGALQLFELHR